MARQLTTASLQTGRRARHTLRSILTTYPISSDGRREPVSQSTAAELVDLFQMMPRDLRLLATNNITLGVREHYYIFRFPPFTGVVASDRACLVALGEAQREQRSAHWAMAAPAGSGVASEVLASEIVRVVQKRTSGASSGDLAGQLYDGLLQGPLPFELRVLDAVLREDLLRKQERFSRISSRMARALGTRDRRLEQRRPRSFGLLTLAADAHAEAREEALYQLITLGDALSSLGVEVKRAETTLEALLRSDEDMAALYLSHRKQRGEARPEKEHVEVELMLEAAAAQYADLEDRILGVRASLAAHRSLEELKLRNERNRIMRLEVLLQMGSLSLALAAVSGGFFGMNLHSGVEEVPHLLWLVAGGTAGASTLLLRAFLRSVRTFHGLQRDQLLATSALQTALQGLDHAYLALRHAGELAPPSQSFGEGGNGGAAAPAATGATLDEPQLRALHHLLAEDEDQVYDVLTRPRGS